MFLSVAGFGQKKRKFSLFYTYNML